jgi:hypothetical protein
MVRAIKEQVTIKPGGVIEIRRPELPTGTVVEVIVMMNESEGAASTGRVAPLSSLFGKVQNCFGNGHEADAFLRAERDAWQR